MFGFARMRETRESTRPGEEQPDSGVRATKSSTCDECGSGAWIRIVREHRTPFRRPVTLVAVQCADCGRTPF
jgi:C4-type Zn-finger protein